MNPMTTLLLKYRPLVQTLGAIVEAADWPEPLNCGRQIGLRLKIASALR